MKIESVFIISHFKEYLNKRLPQFITNLQNTDIGLTPVYLFINRNPHTNLSDLWDEYESAIKTIKALSKKLRLTVVFYGNNISVNEFFITQVLPFRKDLHKTFLLLETDCALSGDFMKKLNQDIVNFNNIWIYGSYYYGGLAKKRADRNSRAFIMNSVAVYNRDPVFLEHTKRLTDYSVRYDVYINILLMELGLSLDKCVDSRYILNVSPESDCELSIRYAEIKENTCVLHTKNSTLLGDVLWAGNFMASKQWNGQKRANGKATVYMTGSKGLGYYIDS